MKFTTKLIAKIEDFCPWKFFKIEDILNFLMNLYFIISNAYIHLFMHQGGKYLIIKYELNKFKTSHFWVNSTPKISFLGCVQKILLHQHITTYTSYSLHIVYTCIDVNVKSLLLAATAKMMFVKVGTYIDQVHLSC